MPTDAETTKCRELTERQKGHREFVVGDITGRVGTNSKFEVRLDNGRVVYGQPTGRMRREARLVQEGDRVIVCVPPVPPERKPRRFSFLFSKPKPSDQLRIGYLWCFASEESYRLSHD